MFWRTETVRNILRNLLLSLCFLTSITCSLERQSVSIEKAWLLPIIPHPQEIFSKKSISPFIIKANTALIISSRGRGEFDAEVGALNQALNRFDMTALEVRKDTTPLNHENAIVITQFNQSSSELDSLTASLGIRLSDAYPGPEGYILDVSPERALVAGHDRAGLFYGVQSLIQLLSAERASAKSEVNVPSVTILDYPDMPLRSAFYGFYLNALENDSLIQRAYRDFAKIARYKFNRIDLASHHYGHVEMEVPGHPDEQLWQRFAALHQAARENYLQPRVGGWAKWVNTDSQWGSDITTLEGIRTSHTVRLHASRPETLKISSGHVAPNVIYDIETGKSWDAEPVIVADASKGVPFVEGEDYSLNFGEIRSEPYQKYYQTPQTNLEVLFEKVHFGEGEPSHYPLRWGETFNRPTTIQRLPTGKIQDGQEVNIAFSYIGPDPWSILKVRYCRSDTPLHTDGPENYIWRWCTQPVRFWGADAFALDVDETRVFAWDKRCLESGKSRSQIWAEDIDYYYRTIRKLSPTAELFMWSDMLDPAHNAETYGTVGAADLFLKSGMTDVVMIPWKSSIARESIAFFADHGFPVMPSCQDVTERGFSEAPRWAHWLRHYYADSGVKYGLMHCNWGYAFDSESTWQQLATVADHSWSVGPYIVQNSIPGMKQGQPVKFEIRLEGDKLAFDGEQVIDEPLKLTKATVYYRLNSGEFNKLALAKNGAIFTTSIPADTVTASDSLEYYIEAVSQSYTSRSPKNAPENLYKLRFH